MDLIMEEEAVCRLCLQINVKMYSLRTYQLDTYFHELLGVKALSFTDLPQCVCYICAKLLQKYSSFKSKCLASQDVLNEIVNCGKKITIESVSALPRNNFKIQFSVSSKNESTLLDCDDILIKEEIDELTEPKTQVDIVEENMHLDNINLDDNHDSEVKDEDYNDIIDGSSDDEPLVVTKIKKEKGKVKTSKKRKKPAVKDGFKDKDTSLSLSLPAELKEFLHPRKKVKISKAKKTVSDKKIGVHHNLTDDVINLDECCTITTLTQEEQLEEITKRQYSDNYLNARYQCELCFKGFIDPNAWKHHLSKHSPSAGDIECTICKFRFNSNRQYHKHMTNHEKKYACNSCKHVSSTATQAKQHQRWHKGVTYKCQLCDEVSHKWTSYLSHVRIKHPSEFICRVCGSSYVSRLGLAMHNTMMHKNVDESTISGPHCKECDIQFASQEAYKKHMVTSARHAEMTLFNNGCRTCGETFKSVRDLKTHCRTQHPAVKPAKKTNHAYPTICQHCPQEISSAREYWNHFRRAHPDQQYPVKKEHICDVCGKGFRGNAFLNYHKRTHSSERQFKCATCGKAFHNPGNLYMHEKIHSELRPYACTVCYKSFKGQGALTRHFRCHTGERPYECEICGKAFSQSNSVKVHVRTVHLKQPAPYLSRNRIERRLRAGAKQPAADSLYA